MSWLFALGGGSDSKESACNVGDLGLIPGLGRSSGGGHGNTFQYSCLENPPGPEEPGGLQSTGLQRVRHDWAWQHTHGIRWPKIWSFNFSISPSNEYAGLISFRMDWFDLLAVLGPHKSLLQHRSLKTSVLQCSAFFMVQLSHNYCKNHSFDYTDLCWQRNASAF